MLFVIMHETVSPDNEYLMTSDAARELEVAKETVLLWERTGKLSAIKASNGFRLFKRSDIERLKLKRERKRA